MGAQEWKRKTREIVYVRVLLTVSSARKPPTGMELRKLPLAAPLTIRFTRRRSTKSPVVCIILVLWYRSLYEWLDGVYLRRI